MVESSDPLFDASARQASWSLQFEPALDGEGRPVPSIIQYRYVFEAAAVPVVSLRGVLYEAGVKRTLPDTEVRLIGPGGIEFATRTDASGAYELADLAEGEWTVAVEKSGFRSELLPVTISAGKLVELECTCCLHDHGTKSPSTNWSWWKVGAARPNHGARVGRRGDPVSSRHQRRRGARGSEPSRCGAPPLNIGQLIIRGMAPEVLVRSRRRAPASRVPLRRLFHSDQRRCALGGCVSSRWLRRPVRSNAGWRCGSSYP